MHRTPVLGPRRGQHVGPTTPGGGNNGIYTYIVRWDDPLANKGTIEPKIEKARYGGSNGTTIVGYDPAPIQKLHVTLRNLSLASLGTITATGDLAFGGNTPITLCVPAVNVLPGQPADQYYWTIPSGWVYAYGNQVSTGARVLIPGTASNCISVTPTPQGTSATVRVSAADGTCRNQGYTLGSETAEVPLTFDRPVPTLSIISDKSPSGGNFSLFCGDNTNYNFRYVTAPATLPAGGSFSFDGAVGNRWRATGSMLNVYGSTSNPTGIVTSGNGPGTVTLNMTYGRNGVSAQVSATPVTVTVTGQVEPPVLPTRRTQCYADQDFFLSATKQSYLGLKWWSPDPDVRINGGTYNSSTNAYTSAGNQVTLRVVSPAAPGNRRVCAATYAPGCAESQPVCTDYSFGAPAGIQLSGLIDPVGVNEIMSLSIAYATPGIYYN